MTRIRIASLGILVAALFMVVPAAAPAASTLLSGYGGPGAGEQAIIGATLLNVPSSGSPGSGGAAGGGGGSSSSGATQSGGSSQGSGTGAGTGGSTPGGSATGGSAGTGGTSPGGTAGAQSFAYPNALRSASADSPFLGLSGGGLAALLAVAAGLAALGALTIRLARLQR